MHGSESGGGKVFGRFAEPAHRVLDLAREEAERCGHRYLGPEHVLRGPEPGRTAAVVPRAGGHGGPRRARWSNRPGVVPGPQPSDAQLLGTLGIDLDAVRRDSEQSFGVRAVGEATWRVTRRPGWPSRRVVWTPLCGPPLFAKRALQLASDQAHALGHSQVRPEHLLLGVLEDAGQPADIGRGSRRHRQIAVHVGLPKDYRGAAGLLLAALEVSLERLRDAALVELGGVRR